MSFCVYNLRNNIRRAWKALGFRTLRLFLQLFLQPPLLTINRLRLHLHVPFESKRHEITIAFTPAYTRFWPRRHSPDTSAYVSMRLIRQHTSALALTCALHYSRICAVTCIKSSPLCFVGFKEEQRFWRRTGRPSAIPLVCEVNASQHVAKIVAIAITTCLQASIGIPRLCRPPSFFKKINMQAPACSV